MAAFLEDYKDRVEKINEYMMRSLEIVENKTLRAAMMHYPQAGGKRLRPLLATLSCEAVGGRWTAAVPFGVALELVHNFTLVHDDVMDNDETRRGIKTVHAQYGMPEAILAGDALFARAFELIPDSDTHDDRLVQLVDIIAKAVRLLAEGQQMDMDFEGRKTVKDVEYMKMIELKTAVLYSAAAQGGAVIGESTDEEEDALREYGRLVGLGFQIWDDVLDLTSDQKTFGKPVLNDIRNGKKTIIVISALEDLHGKDRENLFKALGNKKATPEQLLTARDVLDRAGAIDHAIETAGGLIKEAKEKLNVLKDTKYKKCLESFADYTVTRKS
jgi:geranylgeranyl diphosphate synthase type I